MVFLHCLPGLFGPIVYMFLWIIWSIGSLLVGLGDKDITGLTLVLKQMAVAFGFRFREFIFPGIDVFSIIIL